MHRWGRAYRNGQLVCDRVRIVIGRDNERVGLAPYERRYVSARFLEHTDRRLHRELAQLVSRRGIAARRVAERLEPIEIVIDDRERMVCRLEPPLVRYGQLREIEFGLREPAS